MKKTIESKETFEWEFEGFSVEAELNQVNNEITYAGLFVVKGPNKQRVGLDERELREIHKAMGQLIQEIDNKRGVGRTTEEALLKIAKDYNKVTDKESAHSFYFKKSPELESSANFVADSDKAEETFQKLKSMSSGHDSIQ